MPEGDPVIGKGHNRTGGTCLAHVDPAAEAISSSFEASFTEGTLPARSEDQAVLRDCENWLVRCGIYVG